MFLNSRQDWRHAEDQAEDHVEGDEEFVQLAVADVLTGVERIAEGDGNDDQDVEDESGEEQGPEPILVGAWSENLDKLENLQKIFAMFNSCELILWRAIILIQKPWFRIP